MIALACFWLSLTIHVNWLKLPFTLEERLRYRLYCGVGMFILILVMNIFLWFFWWWQKTHKENRNLEDEQKSVDQCIRYHLSVCVLDMPTLLSLIFVVVGCVLILSMTNSAKTPTYAIASTFYSGAAAFHMLLGNAVFSFIHSGRIHKVIAPHSMVKS
jgi:hypothetical protein